jgi:hypothetical protein
MLVVERNEVGLEAVAEQGAGKALNFDSLKGA